MVFDEANGFNWCLAVLIPHPPAFSVSAVPRGAASVGILKIREFDVFGRLVDVFVLLQIVAVDAVRLWHASLAAAVMGDLAASVVVRTLKREDADEDSDAYKRIRASVKDRELRADKYRRKMSIENVSLDKLHRDLIKGSPTHMNLADVHDDEI